MLTMIITNIDSLIHKKKMSRYCNYSNVEIYEGELHIRLSDGTCLKDDESIVMSYLNAIYVTAGEENY